MRIGDPVRIRQVLLNLVGNAIKFTRNGAISVAAERVGGDDVLFRVSDTGIGVPEADRGRIFEEFVTLDASYARAVGGTGLGLAIARRLVRAMRGEIWVEADAAEGSVFACRLPLPAAERGLAQPPAGAPAPPCPRAAPPLRVLVVEDNAINRLVVRELLELDGHSVDEAHDGKEGVAMAARRAYDLVLMDISMPVLDGVEATRLIRASEEPGRHVPIVALTAHALPGEMERFRAAGLDDTLVKPISRATLGALVDRVAAEGTAPQTEPSPPAEAERPVLNLAQFEETRAALGVERSARHVATFLGEAESVVARLASPPDDAPDVKASVHRLAGSASVLGASALQAHLQGIEETLAAGSAAPDVDVATLATLVRSTAGAFEAALAGDG